MSEYSIIGGNQLISSENWAISMLRKKEGRGDNHVFLILEGLDEANVRFIKRYDLFFDQDKGAHSSNMSGHALIVGKDIKPEGLQDLERSCAYRNWGITRDMATTLQKNIAADIDGKMNYNLLGNGSSYSISFPEEYHNCISWAEDKLKKIGLIMENEHWADCICVQPKVHVPDESPKKNCCVLM